LLAGYLVLFCGFWFMLMTIWDVGPLYFRDWVDTSTLVRDLFGADGTRSGALIFLLGLDRTGTYMLPEGLVNINSMLIMFTCFLVAGLSARLRATDSMAIGTLCAAAALFAIGASSLAWFMVAAIALFSLGEMLASPKSIEYISNIAPLDR